MTPIVVYFDMDDVLCYYTDAMEACKTACPEMKYPQAQVDFFRNLKPNPFAVETFRTMRHDPRFDPWILTAPSMKNPLSYMEKRIWVEQNIGYWAVEKLMIVPDKSKAIGDILIDDQRKGRGQDRFIGELIVPNDYGTWDLIYDRCVTVAAIKSYTPDAKM